MSDKKLSGPSANNLLESVPSTHCLMDRLGLSFLQVVSEPAGREGKIEVRAIARLIAPVCPGALSFVIIVASGIASGGVIVSGGESTFVIPESFPTTVARLQTFESHRRLFASLKIDMRDIELESSELID